MRHNTKPLIFLRSVGFASPGHPGFAFVDIKKVRVTDPSWRIRRKEDLEVTRMACTLFLNPAGVKILIQVYLPHDGFQDSPGLTASNSAL